MYLVCFFPSCAFVLPMYFAGLFILSLDHLLSHFWSKQFRWPQPAEKIISLLVECRLLMVHDRQHADIGARGGPRTIYVGGPNW